jgi:predicted  nucleic acid-binding Zn-ribbon protein
MEVKRYECGNGEGMIDFENGSWVFYEDYDKLKAENEELNSTNFTLQRFRLEDADNAMKREGHLSGQILQLKEKLKEFEDCLRDLLEMQNGAPLIRFEKEFNEIEAKCWKLLTNK